MTKCTALVREKGEAAMTFDQLEVGREYWFHHKNHGALKGVYEDQAGGLVVFSGNAYGKAMITDIRPVPTREECEKLVMIQEKARAVMEWYDRDGSVGGAVDPMDQLRSALAAVVEDAK